MNVPTGVERRRYKRVPLQNVIIELSPPTDGKKYTGMIRDISLGGMLIAFETQPPKPDEFAHVTFILPSAGVFSYIKMQVMRETRDKEGLYALGLEFVNLNAEDRAKLERFFQNHANYYNQQDES